MFCFNPIGYFFKSFIRLFTKKFFWVILIFLLICIGWALYDKGVFAVDYTQINTNYFNESDINTAKNLVGEDIWNNEDYDIFIGYVNGYWGTYKHVSYYNTTTSLTTDYTDLKYVLETDSHSTPTLFVRSFSGNSVGWATGNNVTTKNFNGYTTSDRTFYFASSLSNNQVILKPIRNHFDIYNTAGIKLLDANASFYTAPFIENESSTINNWSFDYLKINSGSEGYVYDNPITGTTSYAVVNLKYTYNGITYTQQISSGYITSWSTDNFIVEFPRTSLLNSVNIENGKSVDFYLEIKKDYVSDIIYSLGTYTFALTTEEQEQIQQDSDKALQGEILGAQQETNNKLDSLENTITDTTVPDDSEFDLPTIEVNDSTANFFDTLFTGIYNAFNTYEDTTISFTIFSKTITINSADFRMLNDNRFTILRNLLESSWYFAIGYMILKDIRHIFDKIKTGNIENAVSNDIKADMV